MKKILTLIVLFAVVACGTKQTALNVGEMTYGSSMRSVYEKVFTEAQRDSICKADNIPFDLSKYHQSVFRDAETNEAIVEYLYIKSLGSNEVIYRLEKRGNDYKISKRVKN